MKALYLSLFISLLMFTMVHAQTYNGSVTLESQTEVDTFNYTSITGSIRIDDQYLDPDSPERIKNLNGLSNLTSVGGNLIFFWTDSLYNVDALSNLTSVGNFLAVRFNSGIENLNGLSNLSSVRNIWIEANPRLTDLSGLSGITTVDTLWVGWNNSLETLAGLSNISGNVVDLEIFRNRLTNLDELSGITSVTDSVFITYEPFLTNLDGLSNIESIGSFLNVSNNINLKSYCGLYKLFSNNGLGGEFIVHDNAFILTAEQIVACGPCSGLNEPIADAGSNKNSVVSTITYLDGSDSYDPGSGELFYNWSYNIFPPYGSNAELYEPTSVSPYFIPDIPGNYHFRLRVNNGCVLSDAAYVIITVLTVDDAIEDLTGDVNNLPLNDGNKNALISKLNNAIARYNEGNFNAAKNILNAFLNQLNQFVVDGKLTAAEAQPLIDYANQILDSINSSLPKSENNVTEVPEEFALHQNYPNPFNPSTTISYQLPISSHVSLKVYDVLGNEVATLVDGTKEAGYYQTNFDASFLASGMYIYRLTANGNILTRKMQLIK